MSQDELYERLQKVDLDALPLDKRVEVFFKRSDLTRQFVKDEVMPILQRKIKAGLDQREDAITLTYFRMYYWMDSLSRLNKWHDFQAVSVAARAMIELHLDMHLLVNDETGSMVAKFHAFGAVHLFAQARKCVTFCDGASGAASSEHGAMRKLLAKPNEEQRVESLRRDNWGLSKKGKLIQPKHWSGMDTKSRAKELDRLLGTNYEKEYVEDYAQLSWHVHSGALGFANLPPTHFRMGFAKGHGIACRKFTEATKACVDAMQIDEAVPDLEEDLGNLIAQLMISVWEEHRNRGDGA